MLWRAMASGVAIPVLAALLVLTTPIGTGQGVHSNDLLQPLVPHVHLVNGRILPHEQAAPEPAARSVTHGTHRPVNGPALGAGSGADPAASGLGIGPTLPAVVWALDAWPPMRLRAFENDAPVEFLAAPSDPPPDLFA